jgi:hypothetical protein
MFAKRDNKVFECTKYTEKEVTLPCDEEVTEDSVTVVQGLNTNVAKSAKKKEKSPKPPPRIDPIKKQTRYPVICQVFWQNLANNLGIFQNLGYPWFLTHFDANLNYT